MAGKNIHEVGDADFEAEVMQSDIPVLVDFWAAWCGPCLALTPTVEAVADEQVGRIKVCKVNVDENPGVAARFGIRSIPTIYLFKNGQNLGQLVGNVPKGVITEFLKKAYQ
jgi:thioredoxin 1